MEIEGDEADDRRRSDMVIATLAVQAANTGRNVLIASSDRRFYARLSGRVSVFFAGMARKRRHCLTLQALQNTLRRLSKGQMVDFLSLLGTIQSITSRQRPPRWAGKLPPN